MTAGRVLMAGLALCCPGHHHRPHVSHHRTPAPATTPAPTYQVDTVRIGTPKTVERITTADGRTIVVTYRPGPRLP